MHTTPRMTATAHWQDSQAQAIFVLKAVRIPRLSQTLVERNEHCEHERAKRMMRIAEAASTTACFKREHR